MLLYAGTIIGIVLALYLSSLYSYLLFHSLIEITTISIGFTLFILTWNAREFFRNDYLKILGIGYAFIAIIDLIHTLAYKGMGVFPYYSANLPTQLWIAARYLQAATLCVAPLFATRKISERAIFATYFSAVAVLFALIYSGHFPTCFIEGKGLSPFKIYSEYVITIILLFSLYLLRRVRNFFDTKVYTLLVISILLTAGSEISFTAYVSVFGFANLLGHFFKLAAYYLVYMALLVTGFKEPFDLIFRDLTLAQDDLKKANDTLEEKVEERTTELRASEEKYRTLIQQINAAVVVHGADTRILTCNSLAQQFLGLTEEQLLGKIAIDPHWHFFREDGTIMPVEEYPVNQVIATKQPLRNLVIGVHHPLTNEDIWLLVSGDPVFNERGDIAQVIITFVDITTRRQTEQALAERTMLAELSADIGFSLTMEGDLRSILNACSEALVRHLDVAFARIWTFNSDTNTLELQSSAGIYTHVDGAHNRITVGELKIGLIAQERKPYFTNNVLDDLRIHDKEWAAREGMVAFAGHPLTIEDRLVGVMAMFSRKPLTDVTLKALASVSNEIAIGIERKLAEKALYRLNRELRAISKCNESLIRVEDEQTLLNEVCRIVCDDAGYRMAWVGYAENDEAKTVRPVSWAGFETDYLAKANITWADTERGRGPTGTSIRNGVSAIFNDFLADPNAAPWRENALQRGYRSSVALPLKDQSGSTFGAITIYSTEPGSFTPNEIRLLEELADDLAFGITILRARIEHEQTEALKREFYRSTILAATDGKLLLTEKEEIAQVAGQAEQVFELKNAQDVGNIRIAAAEAAKSAGFDNTRTDDLSVAVGEAITNAFKHAGGGTVSIHKIPDALMFVIADQGSGIEAMTLPKVVLERGYTTAESLGMGYTIMISMANKVYLATGPGGTTIGIVFMSTPETPALPKLGMYADIEML